MDANTNKALSALELFAGAGGMSLGVHKAGFQHSALIEWDESAAATLRLNRQFLGLRNDIVMGIDARDVNYAAFADRIDLMFGGPPCQPYSTGGRNRGADDERNMFPAFLDAMSVVMPKAVFLENVVGLTRKRFSDYFSHILKRLEFPLLAARPRETWQDHHRRLLSVSAGDFADHEHYVVGHQIVDTADYGIPQRRMRVLIVALRRDLGVDVFKIVPTHSKEALLYQQWITGDYWRRVDAAPCSFLTKADQRLVERLEREPRPIDVTRLPWRTVREAISNLPEPVCRGEQPEIPNHIQHPGARVYKGHIGSYWDYPAKALKAGTHGTPGGENMLRVRSDESVVRYFTTREAARLHTFPDGWLFRGSWGACIKQLGNAVPVDLAKVFASRILERILVAQAKE